MRPAYAAALVLVLASACASDHAGGGLLELRDGTPFRAEWELVHAGAFDATSGAITRLAIGSALGFGRNFVNRGDVIVAFDAPPGTIEIAMRRFAAADTAQDADAVIAKLELWAFRGATDSPAAPSVMDPADRCDAAAWQDDCAIYVYYDGAIQPWGSGADIRVRLPADYHESIAIATADNVLDNGYANRGNVCVAEVAATLEATLENGRALVSVDAEIPYPACPPALVDACVAFDDPTTVGPDAWDKDCPCIADGYVPGGVEVASLDEAAANITVDLSSTLWTSFRADNQGENRLGSEHCVADVTALDDVEFDEGGADPNKPWLVAGIAHKPLRAPAGGFRVNILSRACEPVTDVASPDEWDPAGPEPTAALHGNLDICTGCLAALDCDAQLSDD